MIGNEGKIDLKERKGILGRGGRRGGRRGEEGTEEEIDWDGKRR